jgi:hypothetical protein
MAMDVIVQDAMILMLVKTRSWLLEEQQAAKVVVVRSARYRCCLGGASQLRSPLSARRPDSTLTFHPVFHPDLHQINTQNLPPVHHIVEITEGRYSQLLTSVPQKLQQRALSFQIGETVLLQRVRVTSHFNSSLCDTVCLLYAAQKR